MVILLSPPALQREVSQDEEGSGYNRTLHAMGRAAQEVATEKSVGFGDLFPHMKNVNNAATKIGEAISIGGRLPSEAGHVVIASIILSGLGVTGADLDAVAWSPLRPRAMARIRQAMAIPTRTPQVEPAQTSQYLYESIGSFDEAFFRAWRLSGEDRAPSAPPRETVMATAEQAWGQVQMLAKDAAKGQ